MYITSKFSFLCLVLCSPGGVQSAWISHRTTARQQFLFHGSTIQRSTNPSLSGELLPQGIVDSQTVYRGGLIAKPTWNGDPAPGFREAKSIQSMYYALSSRAETESETEQEILAPPISPEKVIVDIENEYLSENSVLDQVDALPEETGETTEAVETDLETVSTPVLERNGEFVEEADQFAEEEEENNAVESLADYENAERIETAADEIFTSYSEDIIEALEGQTEETIVAEKDQEESTYTATVAIAVAEDILGSATIVTTEETETIDTLLDDDRSHFASSTNGIDDDAQYVPLVTMENDGTTVTEIISAVETLCVKNEAVDETETVFREDESSAALEHREMYEDANVMTAESTSNDTEFQPMEERIIPENNLFEQREADENRKEPFLEESTTSSSDPHSEMLAEFKPTTHELLDATQLSVKSSELNRVPATRMIEHSSIAHPRSPLKRIPLFQRMDLAESKESAFLRVVRRYDEANKRRLELIRQRTSMTESMNGLEDVDALNDLFGKLSSAGIISKAKMYGKRVVLKDGSSVMGKKRKLCIELEWEMD